MWMNVISGGWIVKFLLPFSLVRELFFLQLSPNTNLRIDRKASSSNPTSLWIVPFCCRLFRSTNSRWDVNQSRKKGYSVKIVWEKGPLAKNENKNLENKERISRII